MESGILNGRMMEMDSAAGDKGLGSFVGGNVNRLAFGTDAIK